MHEGTDNEKNPTNPKKKKKTKKNLTKAKPLSLFCYPQVPRKVTGKANPITSSRDYSGFFPKDKDINLCVNQEGETMVGV